MRVRILPRAENDADAIFLFIAKRSPAGAASWWRAFLEAIECLKDEWRHCSLAPESSRHGRELRQFFFKTRLGRNYRAVFIVEIDEILVLRIRGPGQRPLSPKDLGPE